MKEMTNDELLVWEEVRLEEVTVKVGSGSTPRGGETNYKKAGVPLIRSMNVVFFGFKRAGLAHLDDDQAAALNSSTVHAGDVLLNITGASIGRVTMTPPDMDGARVNQHVCIIRPSPAIEARFLNAFLSSPVMQQQIFGENYGVTRQALTKQQILDFEIPLPPLAEQKRIVDKLEVVLGRVDACRARLDRVPDLLKRFRQSVLASATSGQLTEDWRDNHSPETTADYAMRTLGELVQEPLRNGKSVRDGDGIPVLRLTALRNGRFDWSETKRGDWTGLDVERFLAKDGDFLVIRGNGSQHLVGRGGLVIDAPAEVAFPDTLIRVRPNKALILPQFLAVLWNTDDVRNQIEAAARTTTGLWKVAQGDLEAIALPVPQLPEQTEIVRRVEALFALADRIEAGLATAQRLVERLTHATLSKAFRGDLAPKTLTTNRRQLCWSD